MALNYRINFKISRIISLLKPLDIINNLQKSSGKTTYNLNNCKLGSSLGIEELKGHLNLITLGFLRVVLAGGVVGGVSI